MSALRGVSARMAGIGKHLNVSKKKKRKKSPPLRTFFFSFGLFLLTDMKLNLCHHIQSEVFSENYFWERDNSCFRKESDHKDTQDPF